jgi:branched-chain amino acid transport system permease protein
MERSARPSVTRPSVTRPSLTRRYWPLLALCLAVTAIVAIASFGSDQLQVTITEMLIRLIAVIGLYVFIGNSGILSFGHIGFMCIGAYAAAWATVDPTWKQMMLTGLPDFLQTNQYGFLPAVAGGGLLAAVVAWLLGSAIMRLSGIGGSIATFAFLAIVNSVYSNWESVTAATSSIIGVPTVVGPWVAWIFAIGALVVAYSFQVSRFGLMLRASRDDEVAARSSAVGIVKVRLIAFVVSAAIMGVAGALYAHFLGILTADTFYLSLTFVTIAMLVVGGIGSLFGAVTGVIAVTLVVEVLRHLEAGVPVGATTVHLPQGSQEIGLGIIMALIMVFRPSGLTRGREVGWPSSWPAVGRPKAAGDTRRSAGELEQYQVGSKRKAPSG